ncbi:DNA polymerase II small subunit [Candidatus Gugararchaeum adminiculabundum]|nr:DNA polymerase II small subunit [Candidatus Gugararchaeum adminiculabundum]
MANIDQGLLNLANELGVRLAPDAPEFLSGREDVEQLLREVAEKKLFVAGKKDLEEIVKQWESKIPLPVESSGAASYRPISKEYDSKLEIEYDLEVTRKTKCAGEVKDFVQYFRNRFERTSACLRARASTSGAVKIQAAQKMPGKAVRIIAMVAEKKQTKNGHILLELEDEETTQLALILKNDRKTSEAFTKAQNLLFDEVCAFDGKISNQFFIVEDITWPDIPLKQAKMIEEDLAIGMISDMHVGSKKFLEENFRKFLDALKGKGIKQHLETLGKVKYITIAGDLVDGVGVYPNQEKDLAEKDIYQQYVQFERLINEIPDHIEIIVAPGNHDAVRRAEPQPAVSDIIKDLNSSGKIRYVGSPAYYKAHGFRGLMYHGTSLDSIIAALKGMDYHTPEKPMVELLKRRNLSPIYGDNPIVPEEKDYMLIDGEIDILQMGHIHKNGSTVYRGVSVVNSGTWQARTDFQIRQGHVPTPALVPVFEMKYGQAKLLDFNYGVAL